MKHNLFHIASALLLLTACGKEMPQTEPQDSQAPVQFGVAGLDSRASYETAADINSLGLFAYSTDTDDFDPENPAHLPNLLYNREVSRTTGAIPGPWEYSPLAYWPLDPTVKSTFFAYAPHSSHFPKDAEFFVSSRTASGYPTIEYTVPDDVSQHVDILYANPFVANKTRPLTGGEVLYTMKHALTWLLFVVVPEPRAGHIDDEYRITSMRFAVDRLVTCAELNLGSGVWVNKEVSKADYDFIVDDRPLTAGSINIVTPTNSRLMMIPQMLTRASNPSSIDVVYTVRGMDDEGNPLDGEDEYFYSIPFPDTKLHMGNVTIYMIRLSTEGAIVEFLAENTIDDWKQGLAQTVDVY